MMDQSPNPYGDLHIYYIEGCLAPGSTISDASFIGNWEEEGHSFLFFNRACPHVVETLIADRPQLKLLDRFQMSYDEWHGQPVLPVRIGRLNIVPPWVKKPFEKIVADRDPMTPDPADIEILLDPGVVFGTGTHPTTCHCIEAIQLLLSGNSLKTVLDIGTGTGLLAIAAVKLGCQTALAVDLNHLAVTTAANNIHLNKLDDKILAVQGSAENFVDLPSDLVISNIHYDVMKRLFQRDRSLATQYIILSGLLRSQATQVESLLRQVSIRVLEKWESEGIWYSYLGCVSG
jgi:ribosomal protein L11 methyltransferase